MGINAAFYGSHDASICISTSTCNYRIYEFERILKQRYASVNNENFREYVTMVKNEIDKEYSFDNYESCFYAELSQENVEVLRELFGFKHFEEIKHHYSHAAGALYQSDFDSALIISSDSGGNELAEGIQTFGIFHGDKSSPMNQQIKRLAYLSLDVCGAYTLMAVPIKEIYKEDIYSRYLSYAGKIMGLAAYGKIIGEWVAQMKDFYYGVINMEQLTELGNKIGLNLSGINTIEKEDAYNLAATSQFVFERITIDAIRPFVGKYRLPIILTGGGALNVLLNERIKKEFEYPVFVPVNPNDCGLSFGILMMRNPDDRGKAKITYSGFGLLDGGELSDYIKKYDAKKADARSVARMICRGKIIGVVNGNSECGARALGNRSILCDPSIKGIKDKMNKIKQREGFRPFSPVVRLQDANKYFNFEGESEFMSFCPTVKDEWKDKISGIVHQDGTARLQTVTKQQNEFLYDVVDSVDTITGVGVVLNTSFNIKGKPILTTIKDAISILEETELDAVYINGYLFKK